MYCSKCGEKLSEDSKFCTKCGAPINVESKIETVVERFEKDPQLQGHWIKRLIAYVIDSVIVGVATALVLGLALFPVIITNPSAFFNLFSFPFAMGLTYILYFTFAEATRGATIGKGIMQLEVATKGDAYPSFEKAFIRNISKIYWVLLLLDVIGGLLTSKDLHQKYSDRIAHTTVVSSVDSVKV